MSVQTTTRPDRTDWSAVRTRLLAGWHDHLALIPWFFGLCAAGYFQSDLAHQTFGWSYPWALAFPLAIEVGVAWSAGNFHRRLVRRDSAIAARLWLLLLTGFSCSLLFFHAHTQGAPIEGAVAISAMTVISIGVWLQMSSSKRRQTMRARGLVYPAVPNYPVYRWLVCPIETAKAFRHGIKHGIEDPLECLRLLRTTDQSRPVSVPVRTSTSDHSTDPDSDQFRPVQTTTRPALLSVDDMQYIEAIKTHQNWPETSLNKIASIVANIDPSGKCGKTRSIRLRDKALEQQAA